MCFSESLLGGVDAVLFLLLPLAFASEKRSQETDGEFARDDRNRVAVERFDPVLPLGAALNCAVEPRF